MAEVTVEIKGLSKLLNMFERLPLSLRKELGRKATGDAARVIRAEVAARAPVRQVPAGQQAGKKVAKGKSERRYPGNLKKHITARLVGSDVGWVITYRVKPSGGAWYGYLVEYGTKNAPAHPFLRPALDAKAEAAMKTFGDTMNDGLEQAVRAAS